MLQQTVVELEGCNGAWFTLAGPAAGDRGVYLGTGVKGLHDPPVKVMYEEPGNYPGSRYLNHRILRRDIVFGVEILHGGCDSWLSRDAEWRKAWAYDKDSYLHVTTQESGRRTLKVRLGESPDVSYFTDPNGQTVNRVAMVVIAGDPFWYEEDVVFQAVTKTDTRFDPGTYFTTPDWAKMPKEYLTISVGAGPQGALNPTDQAIFPKWTVPGSTEEIPDFPYPFPPNTPIPWERAPFVQWVLPDYDFENEEQANRRLRLPGLIIGEDCVIDTDPRVEQVVSRSGSQVWSRMNGVRFRNPIPPWTESREFELVVSGAVPGQMVTLRLPRPWSRPWGMA